jgi:XTP/dITP diphosphohydrolase
MQTLLIATHNAHKTREIAQMLGSTWEVRELSSLSHAPEIREIGASFEENAAQKALSISRQFHGLVLADDSGLEVDALGGAPGVHSARFAGPRATDEDNRLLLIKKLKELGGEEASARFRCVMVLASRGSMLGSFAGAVEGSVIPQERGHGGFGYDSMFIPNGYDQTFAQLAPVKKNSLSHRARALRKVMEFLRGKGKGGENL